MTSSLPPSPTDDPRPPRRRPPAFAPRPSAALFTWRAIRLRCPECGVSPVFRPLRRTRSLYDWFTPLDGCPRCGYAYEREDGYFLMAVWGVQYGVVALVGLGLGFGLLAATGSLVWSIVGAAVPTAAVGLLFVRYAMAFYLALDHYFDPHLPPAG